MEHRGTQILVLLFWLISMGWLATTKIAPQFAASDRPDQRTFRPESSSDVETQAWKIRWNHRRIGWAKTTTRRFTDGQGFVESEVRLENLTVRQMLKEMFGSAMIMLRAFDLGGVDDQLRVGCRVKTEMNFDAYGRLKRFVSGLELDSFGELISTRGTMGGGKLSVDVFSGAALDDMPEGALGSHGGALEVPGSDGDTTEVRYGALLSRDFEVPEDALIADALLPQSRLTGLIVGQQWTFKSYRAYPPQNPLREVEARVERQEMLGWEDDVEPVFVVSFRDVSGSGLTAASEPNSWLWVRKDGTVLKQQMRMGNVNVDFLRVSPEDIVDQQAVGPSEGSVTVGGFDTQSSAREAKSQLGYVPDQPELYEKLSGREFLQFVAEMHGMPPEATGAQIEDLAKTFEFDEYYDQLTEGYSHGMKQRIAFAAALLHDPAVIILDEPLVGLDPRTMRIVKDTLRRRAANGTTVFMSTHTLGVAEEIADRIGIILHGQLLFLGSVSELRERLSSSDSSLEDLYLMLTESQVASGQTDGGGSNGALNGAANLNGASNGADKNGSVARGAKKDVGP